MNRLRQHLRLFADLLLIKNQQRLREIRIALLDFLDKSDYLRFLAAQTQHGHARHIRMMNVSRKNSAQVRRVFVRRAAALLVRQKFYAVDILENSRRSAGLRLAVPRLEIFQLARFSFAEQLHHFRDLRRADRYDMVERLRVEQPSHFCALGGDSADYLRNVASLELRVPGINSFRRKAEEEITPHL